MAAKLVYEHVTCSRCGGSGTYSYCSMYGSTCFKCGGRKRVPSKAGAKAAAAVKAFMADNFSIRVSDLKPGDRIKVDGRYVRTVESVDGPKVAGWSTAPDGTKTEHMGYTVTFTKPIPSALGPYSSHGMLADGSVVRAVGGADWDRVVAFARTIKKGVTIVEEGVTA